MALLAGCTDSVDSKVIHGLARMVSVPGRVDEATVRDLFGITDANYRRVAALDAYGSYSYRAVGSQSLSYVGVDNLPHYAGGGDSQQQIWIGVPEETCITPEMVRRQTGYSFGPYTYAVEHLPASGPGYLSFTRGGAAFKFPYGRLVMSIDAECSRELSTEKGW
jgi:hypothetical protein